MNYKYALTFYIGHFHWNDKASCNPSLKHTWTYPPGIVNNMPGAALAMHGKQGIYSHDIDLISPN